MSILSRFLKRRRRKIEEQRNRAVARAMASGATPQEAAVAGDRAASGISTHTRLTMMNSINN
ncbi:MULTISPECIES: hypothetical protein [Micromonospora]|uniref:hypothetical protein n=1 Tax=Micromonospora TaxID=1873 RepID=UPI0015863FEE|nr:hypothetical protein [Micromonospora yangpuensis]